MPITADTCRWFIRRTAQGIRAVCKQGDGEQVVGPRFATVNDARRYIAAEYDAGTLSPAAKYRRDVAASIERDGRRQRPGQCSWTGD